MIIIEIDIKDNMALRCMVGIKKVKIVGKTVVLAIINQIEVKITRDMTQIKDVMLTILVKRAIPRKIINTITDRFSYSDLSEMGNSGFLV